MINRIALTASAFAVLAAAANAQVPFLSFADNGTPAVTRTSPADTLSGGNTTSPYTSINSVVSVTNVTYTFNGIVPVFNSGTGLNDDAQTGPGSISVFGDLGSGSVKLFDVSFDSGTLTSASFGASDTNVDPSGNPLSDNVVYSNIATALQPFIATTGDLDSISLSFANPQTNTAGTAVTYQTSGSFASQPVPEPTTMAALGLGALAMLRRRRKA